MSLYFIVVFILLNSCMTYHPNTSIKDLEKDEKGTYLAFTLDSEPTDQDSCWLGLKNSKLFGPYYRVELKKGIHNYILKVEPGLYFSHMQCAKIKFHYSKLEVFVDEGKINYWKKIKIIANFKPSGISYGYGTRKALDKSKFFKGLNEKRLKSITDTTMGGLKKEEILGTIRKNLNEIRDCYEEKLKDTPSAKGKIDVKFIVDLDGNTKSAEVKRSTMNDKAMENCIISKMLLWTYPRPRGNQDITVNYPFSFNPEKNEQTPIKKTLKPGEEMGGLSRTLSITQFSMVLSLIVDCDTLAFLTLPLRSIMKNTSIIPFLFGFLVNFSS